MCKMYFVSFLFILVLAGCAGQSSSISPEETVVKQYQAPKKKIQTNLVKGQVLVPRSMDEPAKYYLLSAKTKGSIIETIHKRVSPYSTSHSKTMINCKTREVKDIAYGEAGINSLKQNPSKWYQLIRGSSKSDLVIFVCKKYS